MKIVKYLYIVGVVGLSLIATSCDDFLDEMPDSRTSLDSIEKIRQILISAYPEGNYGPLCELSADNIVDNRARNPNALVGPLEQQHQEIFEWDDVKTGSGQDAPIYLWSAYYASIASANHALEALDDLDDSEKANIDVVNSIRSEALLIRAYSHFMLCNIFSQAYMDSIASSQTKDDLKLGLGVPYMSKTSSVLDEAVERSSLSKIYNSIEKDIEEALKTPPIFKESYKYHFNEEAAYAFAAQFFLYKRDYEKVVKYADKVLGDNPSSMLRDWTIDYPNDRDQGEKYPSVDIQANLMLIPTMSWWQRFFWSATRYGFIGDGLVGITGNGPTWMNNKSHISIGSWNGGYSNWMPNVMEIFEYTDKVAGTGYGHIIRPEFTTDALLLDRAEAKVHLGDFAGALRDLEYWNQSHYKKKKETDPDRENELTDKLIRDFYYPGRKGYVFEFNVDKLTDGRVSISADKKPYLDCVLHFRRIERALEGYRWFDLKRYGIEISKKIALDGGIIKIDTLSYNDKRRAIQLPQEVIGAGIEANPR